MPGATANATRGSRTSAKRAAQDAAAEHLEHENAKTALAFRKQVAAYCAANEDREIINRFASGDGKEQTLFELSKRKSDGKVFFYEAYGDIKNFPRAARLKRAGNPMEREEEEAAEEAQQQQAQQQEQDQGRGNDSGVDFAAEQDRDMEREAAEDWDREEARRAEAMGAARAKAAAVAAGKKQKRAKTAVSVPLRSTRDGSAEPTRRSSRVAAEARRSGAAAARNDTIREDEEEHHIGNYSAGLRRGQDDLASLLNGLQGCEIKSEMGSESTRIHSRDGSIAVA